MKRLLLLLMLTGCVHPKPYHLNGPAIAHFDPERCKLMPNGWGHCKEVDLEPLTVPAK